MALYKVLKSYKDIKLERKLKSGEDVEMTIKRAEEVEKTLTQKGFKGPFLERIQEKQK
ncbi:hypothetical protein [Staphylococcus agnetis]|uniref:hypothetical protein n=1 Tax=Staphylococcus agnetis TaxID=985762 RepID=UPI000B12672E|nr:hypothetical protein [Staphylococcus agnetis]QJQ71830.1 hypothetical protein EP23_12385 [Staphylococcus agnetis]